MRMWPSTVAAATAVALAVAAATIPLGAAQMEPPPPTSSLFTQPGIVAVDFMVDNLNPGKTPTSNTMWQVSLEVTNFNPILGFSIFFYFQSFGTGGIEVLGFEDPQDDLSFVPGVSTVFEANTIQGGTEQQILVNNQGPILIPPNCDFEPGFLGNCDPSNQQLVLIVFIQTPEPAIVTDILIGGPPDESLEQPQFALAVVTDPPVIEDTPTPVPAPAPTPTPAPARTLSDPHMFGFQGQEFEFTGEMGKIYSLIADFGDAGRPELLVNALFGKAFTSGVSTDPETLEIKPYSQKGTWVVDAAVQVKDTRILVSSDPRGYTCLTSSCFNVGGVTIDDQGVTSVGDYLKDDVTVSLSNSKSFSRVAISSQSISMKVDVVLPPSSWHVPVQDIHMFTHINLVIDSISLIDGQGVLGETASLKYNADGEAITKVEGPNGEGLLSRKAEDYVVPTYFSPLAMDD